jgi:hypothetical protein
MCIQHVYGNAQQPQREQLSSLLMNLEQYMCEADEIAVAPHKHQSNLNHAWQQTSIDRRPLNGHMKCYYEKPYLKPVNNIAASFPVLFWQHSDVVQLYSLSVVHRIVAITLSSIHIVRIIGYSKHTVEAPTMFNGELTPSNVQTL